MTTARRRGQSRGQYGRMRNRLSSVGGEMDPHIRRSPDPTILEVEGAGPRSGLERSIERYAARDFSGLVGIAGLSEPLLRNHFTLYQGYVKAANGLLEDLEAIARKGSSDGPAYSGAKRRFAWEYNGIRLHELYFENLTRTPKPLDPGSGLFERIREDFGSAANWEKDFRAVGSLRGIGWAVVYHDALRHRLFNAWIDQHDVGHLAGCAPVLVLDAFEHAYMQDYGLKKADYIDVFIKGIHWDAVAARLSS